MFGPDFDLRPYKPLCTATRNGRQCIGLQGHKTDHLTMGDRGEIVDRWPVSDDDRHDTPVLPPPPEMPRFSPDPPPHNTRCYRCPSGVAAVYKSGVPLCYECAAVQYKPLGR